VVAVTPIDEWRTRPKDALMARRYFTLDQVNDLIPRLTAIMTRAVQLHGLLARTVRTLAGAGLRVDHDVLAGKKSISVPAHARVAVDQAKGLYESILEEVASVEALGGEVKGVDQGLVDFWSLRDGEVEVLLCWKLGEKRCAYFHTPEAGFAGRQPVDGHLFGNTRSTALRHGGA